MLKTFKGGVHPPQLKGLTADKPIKRPPLPKTVIIPLLQHTGAPCEPLVSVGEQVKTGQVIAKSDKFISSPLHASISGRVTKIDKHPHPVLGSFRAISIENDGSDTIDLSIKKRKDIDLLSDDEIREIIKNAGIVGLGGAMFPAHVKLTPPKGKVIDSVILNGAECEPYLTCDHRLMLERAAQVIEGLKVIIKLTGAANAYIGIEANKIDAAIAMEKALRSAAARSTEVVLLKVKYPQGAEKQLVKSILNREVPAGGLPFDIGCVVSNVGTAFAIYEALFEGKPLYERVVTLTGGCLREPSNLLVRIGTKACDLADACGGFIKEPAKIVFGGPMMGVAQFTLDAPVIKGTSGIIFLSKKETVEFEEGICIRCGRCIEICPVRLVPTTIMHLVKKNRFKEASDAGVMHCFECGACAYGCPARIPLLDYMKFCKSKIKIKR